MNEQIDKAIAEFPPTFGLRGFPRNTFRINNLASYVNDDGIVMLYLQRKVLNDCWLDFAKCTTEELFSQITRK